MVYSAQVYPEMLVRCMRAGAREFLTQPITPATIAEAMVRASVRRPAVRVDQKKAGGKVLIFVGAKGGSGVTTVASNFAVSLAQESDKSTILIDLNLPSGECGGRTWSFVPVFDSQCPSERRRSGLEFSIQAAGETQFRLVGARQRPTTTPRYRPPMKLSKNY